MRNRDKKSLKVIFISSYLLIGILPMMIIAGIFGGIIKQSIYRSQANAMNQISSMVTNNIDIWGDKNIVLVEEVAYSQVIKNGGIEHVEEELKLRIEQDNTIENIFYVDTTGRVLANGLGSLGENMADKEYFQEALKGHSYVSEVFIEDEVPYIAFSAPVRNDGNITGVIISQVAIWGLDNIVGDVIFSEESTIFAFDRKGDVTWHIDKSRIDNENLLDETHEMFMNVVDMALRGNRSTAIIPFDGKSQLVVCNFIDSLNWGTITAIPLNELYAGFIGVIKIGIPVGILILIGIIVLAMRQEARIVKPVTALADLAQRVAKGDLTIKAESDGAKELKVISDAFNEMIYSLRKLAGGIYEKNGNLQEAAETLVTIFKGAEGANKEMAKAMTEISEGAIVQANQTEEVLSGTKDLNEKVEEVKVKLVEINQTIEASKNVLVKAQGEVNGLKEETANQRKLVSNTVQEVSELEGAVGHINKITQTINAIADQTHLLALNASIEAARAGESGKGFAVVAAEIGNLAAQSQSATKDITTILENIQHQTETTKSLMNQIDTTMGEQAKSVAETYEVFKQVEEADKMIINGIIDFSSTVDYIDEFSQNLLKVTGALANIAEESAATTEETTASLQEQLTIMKNLNQLSEDIKENIHELQLSIEHFKIEKK